MKEKLLLLPPDNSAVFTVINTFCMEYESNMKILRESQILHVKLLWKNREFKA